MMVSIMGVGFGVLGGRLLGNRFELMVVTLIVAMVPILAIFLRIIRYSHVFIVLVLALLSRSGLVLHIYVAFSYKEKNEGNLEKDQKVKKTVKQLKATFLMHKKQY